MLSLIHGPSSSDHPALLLRCPTLGVSRPGFQRSKFPKSHGEWPQEHITSDGRLSLRLKGLSISATCSHGGDCGVVMSSTCCLEFHSV